VTVGKKGRWVTRVEHNEAFAYIRTLSDVEFLVTRGARTKFSGVVDKQDQVETETLRISDSPLP